MKKCWISYKAPKEIKAALSLRRNVIEVKPHPGLSAAVCCHTDLVMCKTPAGIIPAGDYPLSPDYPRDAAFCAAFVGKYFIHNTSVSAPELLKIAEDFGLETVNVHQGYAKCSTVIVNENAVITADNGIISALSGTNLDVLPISSGSVLLPGHPIGFLGGASGLIDGELYFCGDLSCHPDFEKIRYFCEEHGVKIHYFPGIPLTDVGSIISE